MYQLRKLKREEGQGLVEYALILVLVAIVVIVILTLLGNQVSLVFLRVTAGLEGQIITGEGTEYIISSFSVGGATPGQPSCNLSIQGLSVTMLQDGSPVAQQSIAVSATSSSGGTGSGSGTTNASGTASIGSFTVSGNCNSGSVTVSIGGNSRTVSY
jgi:pilus assembly protein Flp/PilA